MNWQKLQRLVFVAFLVVMAASIASYLIFQDSFDLEKLREYIGRFGIWAPLVFIALYTVGTIFIPSTPFMAAAGIFFGFRYGLAYTIIGGFLSSAIMFAVSRDLGKEQVESFLMKSYLKYLHRYNKRLEAGGMLDLIILRITPIMPFNVLNFLMGVSKIKTHKYIAGTVLGLIPSNLLTVYFGTFLTRFF